MKYCLVNNRWAKIFRVAYVEFAAPLEKMGVNINAADSLMVFYIYNKLDRDAIIAYEQSLKNPDKIQPLTDLSTFPNFGYH